MPIRQDVYFLQPLQGWFDLLSLPQGSRAARQPWALGRNPFGIQRTEAKSFTRSGLWDRIPLGFRKPKPKYSQRLGSVIESPLGFRRLKPKYSQLLGCGTESLWDSHYDARVLQWLF